MKRSNITTAKVNMALIPRGWSITTQKTSPPACRPTLAGRCRTTENGGNYPGELAPFDKRLGTTQQAYEKALPGWSIAFSTKGIR